MWKKADSVTTAGDIHSAGGATATSPEFLSFVNSATVYVDYQTLFGATDAATFLSTIKSEIASTSDTSNPLIPSTNAEVIRGYKAVMNTLTDKLLPSNNGNVEILLNMMFPGIISVGVAIQSPFRCATFIPWPEMNLTRGTIVTDGCT